MAGIGLVIAASGAPTTGDAALRDRLVGLGHTVTLIDDGDAEHTGLDAYVIAESSVSATVGTKYRNSASPVMVLEYATWDDHGYTPAAGIAISTTAINFAVAHPIVAGITNGAAFFTVATDARTRSDWSTDGVMIGTPTSGGTDFFLWAAEIGGAWPTRRVGLGITDAAIANLAADGWRVFEQAVGWLLGVPRNLLTINQASSDTALAWTAKGTNTTVSRDTTTFKDVPASVKMVATAAGTTEVTTGWRAVKNVQAGKPLEPVVWRRAGGTAPPPSFKTLINWIDAGKNLISPQVTVQFEGTHAADAWVKYTAPNVTPPAGAVEAEIVAVVSNNDAAEATWFDRMSFTPAPQTGPNWAVWTGTAWSNVVGIQQI